MHTSTNATPAPAHHQPPTDEQRLAEAIVQRAYAQERARQAPRHLPRWIVPTVAVLSQSLIIVAALNLLMGIVSMLYPLLVQAFGASALQPIWSAYSTICPQRPSHTWFIGDIPMAMEQRMVSMYVAFGLAGLLYCLRERAPLQRVAGRLPRWSRRPLPLALAVLGVAPALIDVAISTAGILPSTAFSRLWTGSLASLALVAWGYPHYDAFLCLTRRKVQRLQARAAAHQRLSTDAAL